MDMVLNHSSDEHSWFQQSRATKDNPFREFYFWKPAKKGGPPNNWQSFFSGDAWQFDEGTREYYLHLFSRKQPDLNWESQRVRDELKKIIRFWLNKGVDGLRLDVVTTISKRTNFPDSDSPDFNETIQKFYANGPRLKEFIAELRRDVFDSNQTVTVGEGPGLTPQNALDYLDEKNGLSMLFHFGHMFLDQGPGGRFDPKPWTLDEFKKIFEEWDRAFERQGWGSVFLGNHDFARMVSRWGNDGEYREQSSKLLLTLLLTMRGTPFIYQGDEIGMTNLKMSTIEESRDFETINGWHEAKKRGEDEDEFLVKANYSGRDNSRTPFQWSSQHNAGFSPNQPWMGVNPNHDKINAATQERDENSVLNYFRKMVRFRRSSEALSEGKYRTLSSDSKPIYIFMRKSEREEVVVILNFSSSNVDWHVDETQYLKVVGNYTDTDKHLRPWEAIVLKRK
jgi:oligo-1,6-glucosidase